MQQLSLAEENYLKTIFALSIDGKPVNTRAIAQQLSAKDSSVTDMLKKLSAKGLLEYVKYRGVDLSANGHSAALSVIRRHRLWEVFLVQKLGFRWDEVHNIAEQLEHVQSSLLMERMEEFLGFPEVDPHGDPIPNRLGQMPRQTQTLLSEAGSGKALTIVRVKDDSSEFLQYLDASGLGIGKELTIVARIAYDGSMQLSLSDGKDVHISKKVSDQILVSER
ncbi:MAG: metal-dependent transcriptional regulator [Bacteroidia bacterium]|nr:metal-dependent transcriptional regulator [Bacteroidia bacterium]